jgi:hypothetical protein
VPPLVFRHRPGRDGLPHFPHALSFSFRSFYCPCFDERRPPRPLTKED